MENNLPKRKRNRLELFDYSSDGSYFITICTKNRRKILSKILFVGEDSILPHCEIELTDIGKIVEDTLLQLNEKYPTFQLDQYVIMPNHIHLLISNLPFENGRILSSPTVSTVIGQTKRHISKAVGFPIWQRSFYDHIIRNREDYKNISKYICENPAYWFEDELYSDQ